jgi:hypothetical protein
MCGMRLKSIAILMRKRTVEKNKKKTGDTSMQSRSSRFELKFTSQAWLAITCTRDTAQTKRTGKKERSGEKQQKTRHGKKQKSQKRSGKDQRKKERKKEKMGHKHERLEKKKQIERTDDRRKG